MKNRDSGCSRANDLRRGWVYFIFVFFATLLIASVLSPFVFEFVVWLKANYPEMLPAALEERSRLSDFPRYFDRVRWIAVFAMLPLLFRFCKISSPKDIGLKKNIAKPLFQGIGLGGLIIFISGLIVCAVSPDIVIEKDISMRVLGATVSKLVFVALFVAVIEEFLFRGIIFRLFLNGMQPLYAVLFVSFFFAILHFTRVSWNPDQAVTAGSGFVVGWKTLFSVVYTFQWVKFLNLFLVGIFLCLIFLKTRSLWFCIGIHSAWVFCYKTLDKLLNVGDSNFGSFLCYESLITACVVAGFISVFAFRNKEILQGNRLPETGKDLSLSEV